MTEPSLGQRVYPEFARLGAALSSERRLELLDLLAQGERHVEALSAETGMPVASVSQHLQVLRSSKLVESRRAGTKIVYGLADSEVLHLWLTLRSVAETHLPEVERIWNSYGPDGGQPLTLQELDELMERDEVLLVDVRPRVEFEYGHLPGAISIPVPEIEARLEELPRDRLIVTYCRGVYCIMSREAEALLSEHGFRVARFVGGWPEWWGADRTVLTA